MQEAENKLSEKLQEGTLSKATGISEVEIHNMVAGLEKEGLDPQQIRQAIAEQIEERTKKS